MLAPVEGHQPDAMIETDLSDEGIVDVPGQIKLDRPPQHANHRLRRGTDHQAGPLLPRTQQGEGDVGGLAERPAQLSERFAQDDGRDLRISPEVGASHAGCS